MKKRLIYLLLAVSIFSDCKKNTTTNTPPPLMACIAPSRTRIGPSDPVTFTNCSQSASRYLWDFGDGSSVSSAVSPSYSYQNPGVYKVSLTAYNADRSQKDTTSIKIIVDTAYFAPVAVITTQGFTFNTGQKVVCNGSQSLHAGHYSWDFGNSKTSSKGVDTVIYAQPGTYTISLTVYSRDKTQQNTAKENVTIK